VSEPEPATGTTGRLTIDLFTTLDGVAQAPGGPEEDPSDGFPFGGWQAPHPDDMVGRTVLEGITSMDALLLGRLTYDIFSAYWPQHGDDDIGRAINTVPRYVASRDTGFSPDWAGTTRVGDDLATELAAMRARHREIHVIGSVDLVQPLLAERLWGASDVDELRLWVYPVVLGSGKRVFPEGAAPGNLRLIAPPLSGSAGAVLLRYAPEPGVPETGTMGPDPEA